MSNIGQFGRLILRNTGEFPVEISGKHAFKFANYIFTRDVNKSNQVDAPISLRAILMEDDYRWGNVTL